MTNLQAVDTGHSFRFTCEVEGLKEPLVREWGYGAVYNQDGSEYTKRDKEATRQMAAAEFLALVEHEERRIKPPPDDAPVAIDLKGTALEGM